MIGKQDAAPTNKIIYLLFSGKVTITKTLKNKREELHLSNNLDGGFFGEEILEIDHYDYNYRCGSSQVECFFVDANSLPREIFEIIVQNYQQKRIVREKKVEAHNGTLLQEELVKKETRYLKEVRDLREQDRSLNDSETTKLDVLQSRIFMQELEKIFDDDGFQKKNEFQRYLHR